MQGPDRSIMKHFLRPAALALGPILLLAACASTPQPPTASLTEARRAIQSAEQADARQYAGAELDEARRQLTMAERAVERERMTEAERFARQSQIAAELAMARTGSAKAAEINHELRRSTDALIEEMRRTGGRP